MAAVPALAAPVGSAPASASTAAAAAPRPTACDLDVEMTDELSTPMMDTAAASSAAPPPHLDAASFASSSSAPPSSVSAAVAAASALRRVMASSSGCARSLAQAQRALSERATYAHASCASFRATLHASPSRGAFAQPHDAFAAATAAPSMSPTKTASSASLSTATGGAVPAALSYSAEQALIADADTFLHTLGWGLRLPARVQADAALSLRKYAALVPLQQPQPFIIPPVLPSDGGGDAFTPSSSPATFTPSAYSSTSFLGGLELVALLSPAPPQGLYLLATAALFLAAKAGDTPRKLNDFIDAHIVLASILLRLRKSKEPAAQRRRGAASAAAAALSGAASLERVRAIWRDFFALHALPTSALASPATPSFHPSSLSFPSSAAGFSPPPEWTALRESVVYAEFLLLTTATEFAFNASLGAGAADEEDQTDADVFQIVQRLFWQLVDRPDDQEQDDVSVAEALVSPASSTAATAVSSHAALRASRLAWSLTHAAVRSSVFLHSNPYVVAIAIVFLAVYPFQRRRRSRSDETQSPAASAAESLVRVSLAGQGDGSVVVSIAADVSDTAAASSSGLSTTAVSTDDAFALDLDASVDRLGWAPRFRVVDSPATGEDADVTAAASPANHPLRWWHALSPTLSDELLLALCELVVEAGVTVPPLPGLAEDAGELQRLADAYPWKLCSEPSAAAIHAWSNAAEQVVVEMTAPRMKMTGEDSASGVDETPLLPYEDPYPPRIVLVKPEGSFDHIGVALEDTRGDERRARRERRRGGGGSKREGEGGMQQDMIDVSQDEQAPIAAAAAANSLPMPPMPVPAAGASTIAAPAHHHGVHPSRLAALAASNVASAVSHAPASFAPPLPPPVSSGAVAPPALSELEQQLARAKEAIRRTNMLLSRDQPESKAPPPAEHAGPAGYPRGSSRSRSPHSHRSRSRSRDHSRSGSTRRHSSSSSYQRQNGSEREPQQQQLPPPHHKPPRSSREHDRERERERERERYGGGEDSSSSRAYKRARRSRSREGERGRERDRGRERERERYPHSDRPVPAPAPSEEFARFPPPAPSSSREEFPRSGSQHRHAPQVPLPLPLPPPPHHPPPPPPHAPPASLHGLPHHKSRSERERWEQRERDRARDQLLLHQREPPHRSSSASAAVGSRERERERAERVREYDRAERERAAERDLARREPAASGPSSGHKRRRGDDPASAHPHGGSAGSSGGDRHSGWREREPPPRRSDGHSRDPRRGRY